MVLGEKDEGGEDEEGAEESVVRGGRGRPRNGLERKDDSRGLVVVVEEGPEGVREAMSSSVDVDAFSEGRSAKRERERRFDQHHLPSRRRSHRTEKRSKTYHLPSPKANQIDASPSQAVQPYRSSSTSAPPPTISHPR